MPASVEVGDAASILPRDRIVRHKATGSVSLFSNLFRYELIRRGLGLWIDCDVYCVRPIRLSGYVFGWQHPNELNGAVLGLTADEPVLERLIGLFTTKSPVPPWLPDNVREQFQARKFSGEEFTLADLPWGSAGPNALTYMLTEAGLARHAQSRSVFYPISETMFVSLLAKQADPTIHITPQTLTVHLWNEILRRHMGKMEPGSALDRLSRHGTLFEESRLSPPS